MFVQHRIESRCSSVVYKGTKHDGDFCLAGLSHELLVAAALPVPLV